MTMAGLLALLLCMALEAWRPAFFFTNDNVTQWMPPLVETARRLQAGQPALISEFLYGGNYDWTRDASVFPFISPLLPLLAPFAKTSSYYLLVDAIAVFELIVIAISFAAAATWLRRRHSLLISDLIIVLASLSYAFTPLSLLFATSWMGFVNAQAGWPLIYIALQFRSAWRAIALIASAFLFSLFGGNLHPFAFLAAGGGCWAIYFSCKRRSGAPLLSLFAGLAVVIILAFVILGPGLSDLVDTGHIRHFAAEKSSRFNVMPWALAASTLLGPFSKWITPASLFGASAAWSAAMAYSVINPPTAVALMRGGWRDKHARSVLIALMIVVVFIWRPLWLADLLAQIPVLRSTRWPFREVTVLLFHLHLLFILTYRPLPGAWNRAIWAVALIPIAWLIASGPPTMGTLAMNRRLIMTGAADAYWNALRPRLGPEPNLVSIDFGLVDTMPEDIPFALLGSHNFPAIFGVVSVSGYSSSTPLLLERERLMPPDVHGIYTMEQARIFLEHFPHTRLTLLRGVGPPIWSIFEKDTERRLTLDPETLEIQAEPK